MAYDDFGKDKDGFATVKGSDAWSQSHKVDHSNFDSSGASKKATLGGHFDTRNFKNLHFFAPLSDEFKCPVCTTLLNDPQLMYCGHRFCRSCVENLLKKQSKAKCPVCNDGNFHTMTDKLLERKIKELKVNCVNREGGCEWAGELLYLEDHLQKQCLFVRVSCPYEFFGCKVKLFRRDLDAHVSDMLDHMTLVLGQFEAQQQSFDRLVKEKDAKICQLEQSIDEFESNVDHKLNNKSNITWTNIDPCHPLFLATVRTPPGIKPCHVPEQIVPDVAKELLIMIGIHCSGVTPHGQVQCISVFVEEDGVHYSKYIKFSPHKMRAWNDNIDNVWLPMPRNRVVHVHIPVQFGNSFWSDVLLIGYR